MLATDYVVVCMYASMYLSQPSSYSYTTTTHDFNCMWSLLIDFLCESERTNFLSRTHCANSLAIGGGCRSLFLPSLSHCVYITCKVFQRTVQLVSHSDCIKQKCVVCDSRVACFNFVCRVRSIFEFLSFVVSQISCSFCLSQ